MDATFEWHNPEQTIMVLHQNAPSTWTLTDQTDFMDDLLNTIMRRRQPIVIVVVCASENAPIPNYMSLISHLRHHHLDNIKGAVFVNATMYVRTFVDLAQRLKIPAAKDLHYVTTLKDALVIAESVLKQHLTSYK
jgi:hypothetical protein